MSQSSRPFIVLSLPRSRSAWMSRFLSYGDWFCGHEQVRYARGLDDLKSWFSQPQTGTCETSAGWYWRLLEGLATNLRVAIVRRPVDEVLESLAKLGWQPEGLAPLLRSLDRKLEQAAGRLSGALSITYNDLGTEAGAAALFEHCLPIPHSPEWWRVCASVNVQANFPAIVRYMGANAPQLRKLNEQVRQKMLMELGKQQQAKGPWDIQPSSIAQAIESCAELFAEHCLAVGESPDNWRNKNIPLMLQLEALGRVVCLVGRDAEARPQGYLFSFISPSFEALNREQAHNGMFYARPSAHGLGLKLQREMVRALRARGVYELFARDGVRGSGGRLAPLYKRLGGEPFGELYRVALED